MTRTTFITLIYEIGLSWFRNQVKFHILLIFYIPFSRIILIFGPLNWVTHRLDGCEWPLWPPKISVITRDIHVCVVGCVCVSVCEYVWLCVLVSGYVSLCLSVSLCVSEGVCSSVLGEWVYVFFCVCECKCLAVCVSICLHVSLCLCVCVSVLVCLCVCDISANCMFDKCRQLMGNHMFSVGVSLDFLFHILLT